MNFVDKVISSLTDGHNNQNKIEKKLESKKYSKYTSREYAELCEADAKRAIVAWAR